MVSINNAINNTVGATNSGQTNTFTITNPSNTASSAARETIAVGGSSAADPTINFNVSGVTNWEMGIDNSDSDSFIIAGSTALGTDNYLRLSTAGVHTLPKQPLFIAHKNTTNLNSTGDGTAFTAVYNSVYVDQASNYNIATGEFTAPVTGNYFISLSLFVSGLAVANTTGDIDFYVNGVNSNRILRGSFGSFRAADNSISFTQGVPYPLTAGDVVKIVLQVSGGAKVVACGGGLFSIFLIC